MDLDGDLDVLSASFSDRKVAWFANLDGLGLFSNERVITTKGDGAMKVFAVDVDGDGDLDVIANLLRMNTIYWYANLSLSPNAVRRWRLYD